MKKKNNPYTSLYSASILFFLVLGIFIVKSYHAFYKNYQIYSSVVIDYDTLEFMIDDSSYRRLNKNKVILLEGKIYNIKIKNVVRNILKKDDVVYHQIQVFLKLPKKYSLLEVISIALYDDKRGLFTIFKSCLKGEDNEENR